MKKPIGKVELLNQGILHMIPVFNQLPNDTPELVLLLQEPVQEETAMARRTGLLYRGTKKLAEVSLRMDRTGDVIKFTALSVRSV